MHLASISFLVFLPNSFNAVGIWIVSTLTLMSGDYLKKARPLVLHVLGAARRACTLGFTRAEDTLIARRADTDELRRGADDGG